jgi:hypothetical protein
MSKKRHERIRYFRNKMSDYVKNIINEFEAKSKNRNIKTCIGA